MTPVQKVLSALSDNDQDMRIPIFENQGLLVGQDQLFRYNIDMKSVFMTILKDLENDSVIDHMLGLL